MIGCLHVRRQLNVCLTGRDSDEWSGTHQLDVLRVNLALFACWWGLESIYLALSVLLINTNCITSGAGPNRCALSAPVHRWIGLGILAMLLLIHIREKHVDSNWIHLKPILLIMYINSKLRIIVLSFDRKVNFRMAGGFVYHDRQRIWRHHMWRNMKMK